MPRPAAEIFVPDLPRTAAAQCELGIGPGELVRTGLEMAFDPTVPKKIGGAWLEGPLGFVAPHIRNCGKAPLYIRGNFPQANNPLAAGNISLPKDREGLAERVVWQAGELELLRNAGAVIPVHYPVLFRSEELFRDSRWGIFTAVQSLPSPPNTALLWERDPVKQKPLRQMAAIMLRYYTNPPRETVIHDLASADQASGRVLFDLDPYQGPTPNELRRLALVIEGLAPCSETATLQQTLEQNIAA